MKYVPLLKVREFAFRTLIRKGAPHMLAQELAGAIELNFIEKYYSGNEQIDFRSTEVHYACLEAFRSNSYTKSSNLVSEAIYSGETTDEETDKLEICLDNYVERKFSESYLDGCDYFNAILDQISEYDIVKTDNDVSLVDLLTSIFGEKNRIYIQLYFETIEDDICNKFSQANLAKFLGVSKQNVNQVLSRARKKLWPTK
jgi:hypothetical protein